MKFRLITASLFGFASISLGVSHVEASGSPLSKCMALQTYFNEHAAWDVTTSFKGFENKEVLDLGVLGGLICRDGYITEDSPMGRRVCRGNIYFNSKDSFGWTPTSCRWRN